MVSRTEYNRFPSSLEPWPYYYRFRGAELDLVKRALPGLPGGLWLDIGCGIGFMSMLLAERADRVLGIDLPYIDESAHSRGLDATRELGKNAAKEGVWFAGGSAVELPLADESVDLVFSAYTFEHVPNREKAAAEAARVLKPGGTFVFLLPGAAERVTFIPAYYMSVAGEMWKWLRNRGNRPAFSGERRQEAELSAADHEKTHLKRFRQRHPEFPRVAPHGDYPNSCREFQAHRRSAWVRLLSGNGLEVESIIASFFVPTQLIDRFSSRLRMRLYDLENALLPLEVRKNRLFLTLAQGLIFTGKKQ